MSARALFSWLALVSALTVATSAKARPTATAGPRVGVVNRGLGRPDVGVGVAASVTLPATGALRAGLSASALGTGFTAGAAGLLADLHGSGAVDFGLVEVGAGAGISFLSTHLCGPLWCGRQTGVVPSGSLRLRYAVGRKFAVTGEAVAHWVPESVILPGLNGRANLGVEWSF